MVVVAHHRVGGHINGKHRGQLTDACFYPTPAVFKRLAGVRIVVLKVAVGCCGDHPELGAAPAGGAAEVPRGVGQGDEGGAGAGHEGLV